MSHRAFLAVLVIALALLGSSLVVLHGAPAHQGGNKFIRYVSSGAKTRSIDDPARLLHIQQLQGRVELSSGFRNMTLVLTAYKDGKKVTLPDSEVPDLGQYETNGSITYSVQIADLDYLPLGGGKKGYCRMRITFHMPDDSTMSLEKDIPKTVIDLSNSSNLGFTEAASTDREAPLLWLKTGNKVSINVKTPEEAIQKNQDGSLLFLTLRFNDPDKTR